MSVFGLCKEFCFLKIFVDKRNSGNFCQDAMIVNAVLKSLMYGGLVATDHRSSLSGEKLDQILFLRENALMANFDLGWL